MNKRAILSYLLVLVFLWTVAVYGGATFSRVKSWTTGESLTASDLNAEFDNILNNLDPTGIDDESADDSAAQATDDPYSGGSLGKAVSLEEEIQQIRYLIAQITGETYWYIDPDTNLSVLSNYDTIWLDPGNSSVSGTNGAPRVYYEYTTNDVKVYGIEFDGATKEYAAWQQVMPENWDRGTIKAKFYWAPATDGATVGDTVEWGLMGLALGNDDAIDAAYTDTGEVISDTLLAGTTEANADMHLTSATPAITINGSPALNDIISFVAYRNVDGTDDMTEDAKLFGVLIQYTISNTPSAW